MNISYLHEPFSASKFRAAGKMELTFSCSDPNM